MTADPNRPLSESFNNALDGLVHGFRTERQLRIHAGITVAVLTFCLFLDLSNIEIALILFSITLVVFGELMNTAVEALVNLLSPSHHPLARVIKDVSAGAVLVAVVNAAFVGYLVLWPAVNRPVVLTVLEKIRGSQMSIIMLLVGLLLVALLVGRAVSSKSKVTRVGLISGHAALAFAASTVILLVSKNLVATLLAFLLAVLVAQSRVEANFQRWMAVLTGALLGVISSLVLFQVFYSVRGAT